MYPASITFSLASRLLISGEISVVLQLYRKGQQVLTSTLMVCGRQDLPVALDLCRSHLKKLGVGDARPVAAPLSGSRPWRETAQGIGTRPMRAERGDGARAGSTS